MKVEENIPLAPLTTFHIGGPAKFLIHVSSFEELQQSLGFAREKHLKVLILGGGSNILVPDEGFDGLVIKIELKGVELHEIGDKTQLVAAAGESWDALVERAVKENLWGVENL